MDRASRPLIYETRHWRLTHRADSALPGYLVLGAKEPSDWLAELPADALSILGPLLAAAQSAIVRLFRPTRVYVGRYGHSPGHPFHFHLIPVYPFVEDLFWNDRRYRVLQAFSEPVQEGATDGAELTFFIWREFCERREPPEIVGPTVDQACEMLRDAAQAWEFA